MPFTISCGQCWFCKKGLYSCCDRTNPNAEVAIKAMGRFGPGLFHLCQRLSTARPATSIRYQARSCGRSGRIALAGGRIANWAGVSGPGTIVMAERLFCGWASQIQPVSRQCAFHGGGVCAYFTALSPGTACRTVKQTLHTSRDPPRGFAAEAAIQPAN